MRTRRGAKVAVAGSYVGVKSPLLDCVALPVGHHELYITWLDPATHAVVEVVVMNFANRTVCNCVPGSAAPERAR
jgi:hypothetical protein